MKRKAIKQKRKEFYIKFREESKKYLEMQERENKRQKLEEEKEEKIDKEGKGEESEPEINVDDFYCHAFCYPRGMKNGKEMLFFRGNYITLKRLLNECKKILSMGTCANAKFNYFLGADTVLRIYTNRYSVVYIKNAIESNENDALWSELNYTDLWIILYNLESDFVSFNIDFVVVINKQKEIL